MPGKPRFYLPGVPFNKCYMTGINQKEPNNMWRDLLCNSSLRAFIGLLLVAAVSACAVKTETQVEQPTDVGTRIKATDIRHVRPQDIKVRSLPDLVVTDDVGFSVVDCELSLTIRNEAPGGVPANEHKRAVLFIYVLPRGRPGEYTRYIFRLFDADPEGRLLEPNSEVTFNTGISVSGNFVADLNLDPHDVIVETDETNGDVTTLMEAPPSCSLWGR